MVVSIQIIRILTALICQNYQQINIIQINIGGCQHSRLTAFVWLFQYRNRSFCIQQIIKFISIKLVNIIKIDYFSLVVLISQPIFFQVINHKIIFNQISQQIIIILTFKIDCFNLLKLLTNKYNSNKYWRLLTFEIDCFCLVVLISQPIFLQVINHKIIFNQTSQQQFFIQMNIGHQQLRMTIFFWSFLYRNRSLQTIIHKIHFDQIRQQIHFDQISQQIHITLCSNKYWRLQTVKNDYLFLVVLLSQPIFLLTINHIILIKLFDVIKIDCFIRLFVLVVQPIFSQAINHKFFSIKSNYPYPRKKAMLVNVLFWLFLYQISYNTNCLINSLR
eukprot:TRINITY_DN61276_c0_g1_i1.p1 TRINITY_DN61276_c0_g1~~TRINITY_DN61276_c0_g1_i1.p1  ORF type:complete len:332 (+),score=-29.37 TRINITY_DN61276_c0_g1_i1:123-1118(+)